MNTSNKNDKDIVLISMSPQMDERNSFEGSW